MSVARGVIIEAATQVIDDEYRFHEGQFRRPDEFSAFVTNSFNIKSRRYIFNDSQETNYQIVNYDLYRRNNGGLVYGIIKQNNAHSQFGSRWTLIRFTTNWNFKWPQFVARKSKRKKKSQSRKTSKVKADGRSYDPKPSDTAIGHIKISQKLTTQIIPSRIKEKHIGDIFQWMCKSIKLMVDNFIIDNKIWILFFDFHDDITNEPLYFIADRIDENMNENRGYKWKVREELYDAKQIYSLNNLKDKTLPTTIRNTETFKSKMNDVIAMKQLLNNAVKREHVFSTRVSWEKVPVFTNNEINKTQMKLTKTKPIFVDTCKQIANQQDYAIELIPILLFNHNDKNRDGYDIDGLWRINMDGNDIGISFKFNKENNRMYPSGIHICKQYTQLMCQLVDPTKHKCTYFDGWQSLINDLAIGNPKDMENILKAKQIECEQYKEGNLKKGAILSEILIELKQYPSLSPKLQSLIQKADKELKPKNCNNAEEEKTFKAENVESISMHCSQKPVVQESIPMNNNSIKMPLIHDTMNMYKQSAYLVPAAMFGDQIIVYSDTAFTVNSNMIQPMLQTNAPTQLSSQIIMPSIPKPKHPNTADQAPSNVPSHPSPDSSTLNVDAPSFNPKRNPPLFSVIVSNLDTITENDSQ